MIVLAEGTICARPPDEVRRLPISATLVGRAFLSRHGSADRATVKPKGHSTLAMSAANSMDSPLRHLGYNRSGSDLGLVYTSPSPRSLMKQRSREFSLTGILSQNLVLKI